MPHHPPRAALLLLLVLLTSACGSDSSTGGDDGAAPAADDEALATGRPGTPDASPPAADLSAAAQPEDIGTDRPVVVALTLAGNRDYDGTYHARGLARVCGNPLLAMMGKEHGFVFEFPTEGDYEIVDVAFGAEDLAVGSTTSRYRIAVGVKAKGGGRPPAFVVRAGDPQFGETGQAARTEAGGTTRLTVDGVNDRGWRLHMTVECGPRG